ncbi:hypothetical protein M409DRAFT_52305 [Zasmidium cellare ATCC 36951]|uniref:Uncharacterized protein n=1 Tax=Zasmidium cellare ATCC 36951 TaxID=1080233 RepID=A0A6A6CUF2_ZASCE|nr:uncharacterized protein M409DRAFT_52305 [Zasmidium cellare ATCC 36951]KAF2169808.1 hypothetical protein M409DRAFT_52305 [Zasmidium cellare ATCC 36951]
MATHAQFREYVLPNNAAESDRLDFQHILLTRTFQGSTAHHSTHPNLCESWTSAAGPETGPSTSRNNRSRSGGDLRCHEHLLPGGSVEIQEFCMPCKSLDEKDAATSKFIAWSNSMISVGSKIKLNLQIMNDMPDLMKNAALQDVQEAEFRMLTGPWMEDEENQALGRMGQQNLLQGMYGFGETLHTKILGWSVEEYQRWVDGITKEMREDGLRTWLPVRVCYGRRNA